MIRRVQQYINQHRLLNKQSPVLVALSGGADSVALLHVLCQLGYNCIAAHCNFHLRGDESDRDEQFVRDLCANLRIPLHITHFDTATTARQQGISIEMAARNLRYNYFEQCRQQLNCQAVAVAHHQHDQAETIILNIKRGTGIRGLAGMFPRNAYIVRPLLCVQRTDILAYIQLQHLSFVTDSTNADTGFQRNAIRKQLENYSSSDILHFANLCEHIQGYIPLIEDTIAQISSQLLSTQGDETKIHIPTLLRYPYAQTILFELLYPYGFTNIQPIFTALTKKAGKRFNSEQFSLLKDRDCLLITPLHPTASPLPAIRTQLRSLTPDDPFPCASEHRCFLRKSILDKHLTIRHWKEGDFFYPLGMNERKKISDFLTDLKLSLNQKEQVLLLCADNDIAWVIGYRIDERYKVKDKNTQIAEITIINP